MNNNDGALSWEAYIGHTRLNQDAAEIENRIRGISNTTVAETKKMSSAFSGIGAGIAAVFATDKIASLIGDVVRIRGEFQSLNIAFTTMLGNKDKADALMSQVVDLAARSPLSLDQVASGAKQLLAFQIPANEVIDTLRRMGDVASGLGVPLDRLILAYGQVSAKGKLMGDDMRQFTEAGIPLVAELANKFGVTTDKIYDMVSAGKVGFKDVKDVLSDMTNAGGQFYNLMDKNADTVTGKISNLKDKFTQAANAIGESNEGLINGSIDILSSMVEHYEAIGKTLLVLVATYGTYKAALFAVNAIQGLQATTAESLAAALNLNSGTLARNIALNIAKAEAAAKEATATAQETAAKAANAAATEAQTRSEFASLAAKEATANETAKSTALILANAQARVAASTEAVTAAEAEVAALTTQFATSKRIAAQNALDAAQKELLTAQNELNAASEEHLAATKVASSLAADVNAKQHFVETAAKEANTLSSAANAAAETADTAAKAANAAATERLTIFTVLQTKAQQAFNLVADANPYVLLATAVIGLTATVWAFSDSTTAAERAQKEMNDTLAEAKKQNDELKSQLQQLDAIVRGETSTTYEKIAAYKQLQGLMPAVLGSMTQQQFLAMSSAQAQREWNAEIDKSNLKDLEQQLKTLQAAQKDYIALTNLLPNYTGSDSLEDYARQKEAQLIAEIQKRKDLEAEAAEQDKVAAMTAEEKVKYYQQQKDEIQNQVNALLEAKNISEQQGSVIDQLTGKVQKTGDAVQEAGKGFLTWNGFIDQIRLDNLQSKLADITKTISGLGSGSTIQNKAFFETQKKNAQDALDALGVSQQGSAAWNAQAKLIRQADDELKKYNVTATKTPKPKAIDIALPAGSVAEYDREIQKLQDVLSKTPIDQADKVKGLQDQILDLTAKRTQAQKVIELKTWQETLDEKEKQYQAYEDAIAANQSEYTTGVENLNADEAKKYYAELLKGGENYVQFLRNQMEPLQEKVFNGTATSEEFAHLITLQTKLNSITGTSSPFKQFTDGLDNMKSNVSSTSDYIDALNSKLQQLLEIPETMRDGLWYQEFNELKERIKDTSNEAAQSLKQFLQQVEGSEQQRLAITKKYADLRAQAEKQGLPTTGIDAAEQKELQDLTFKTSKAFKDLNKTIVGDGVEVYEQYGEKLQAALKEAIADYGEDSEEVRRIQQEIIQNNDNISQVNTQKWNTWLQILGQAADEFKDMNGAMGAIAQLLSSAVSSSSVLVQQLSKSKTGWSNMNSDDKGSTIAAAVSGISSLIGGIVSASKNRKAAEKARTLDLLESQLKYNIALNEQIRLETILNENVYFKDYAGRIKDAMGAATDAVSQYNNAMQKLMAEGEAVNAQRNAVDWGAVGAATGAGAGAGAAIGSFFPGLGNVIGAAVGAVVGFVTGIVGMMKKKDIFGPLLDTYPDLIDANGELNKSLAQTLLQSDQLDDKTKVLLQNVLDAADAYDEAKKQIDDIISDLTGNLGNDLRDALVQAFEDGTDSAKAFADTVESTLNNALQNLIFSAVFSQAFDNLQKELEGSLFGQNGEDFTEVFANFLSQYEGLTGTFNDAMKAAQDEAKKYGFDLFNPANDARAQGVSGISASITEDTGTALLGTVNAMRIAQAENAAILRNQLSYLSNISGNSNFLSYLKSIDKRLANMEGAGYDFRSQGFSI